MKTLWVVISIIFTCSTYSQTLILEENFNYGAGDLTTVTPKWTESPGGSVAIEIVSGNLTYTDYPSSGIGNKIVLDGGASGRSGVHRLFTTQSEDGTTVYCSFLLNVNTTDDMDISTSDGDYFFNFQYSSASSATRGNIYVRQGVGSSKFSIGLVKSGSSSLTWYSTELDVGTTYLIVVAYSFFSGSDDDVVKLWINPDLSGSEPSADIEISSGTDATDLGYIQFKQRPNSGDMDIDGLRVSDSWSQAPLPVELTSFSANKIRDGVQLIWRTETEINNFGFEIERSEIVRNQNVGDNWILLGFVEGHGNSNSPKNYSYIDLNIEMGKYNYRLKQIDNDGSFAYSKVVQMDLGTHQKFELQQNYPNPFNPITTIKFHLPERTGIKLTVFNILGETVMMLIDEILESGLHTINFNADKLMSGIYFYKLQTANFNQVKKMILVK